ncbi:hypothetical protein B0O99DRAFT_604707 [Bisporella sp. PMI_857]|nr:hypothetical protein B0O99DRAFT_604707 [Bisporella sp. PMI_857]
MAPIKPRRSKAPVVINTSDEEEPDSQESSLQMLETAREMVEASKKKRDLKRASIEDDQRKRVKEMAKRVNVLFDARKSKVIKAQNAQWARLEALNKKRIVLETQILASMSSIEQHTANIITEMDAMLQGRIEDTQGGLHVQGDSTLEGTTLKD